MADPFDLFQSWFTEALATDAEANAMTLATADADGRPDARIVLLKGHGRDGFMFYTNRTSRKATELAANPRAALLFHWKPQRRQVRIEGAVSLASDAESDAYFASRPRDSQLGAWASLQSQPLDSRETFEARFAAEAEKYAGRAVPRPPHWGGYRLVPDAIEFWQDREFRLHERRRFTRVGEDWREGLLYP